MKTPALLVTGLLASALYVGPAHSQGSSLPGSQIEVVDTPDGQVQVIRPAPRPRPTPPAQPPPVVIQQPVPVPVPVAPPPVLIVTPPPVIVNRGGPVVIRRPAPPNITGNPVPPLISNPARPAPVTITPIRTPRGNEVIIIDEGGAQAPSMLAPPRRR